MNLIWLNAARERWLCAEDVTRAVSLAIGWLLDGNGRVLEEKEEGLFFSQLYCQVVSSEVRLYAEV